MATRTKASKNDHITTLLFVLSLTARWIRSRTSMYSCSCLAPENIKSGFDFTEVIKWVYVVKCIILHWTVNKDGVIKNGTGTKICY